MGNTVLHIDGSARFEDSVSRKLSKKITEDLKPQNVIRRDLADGVDFLDETWVEATFVKPEDRSAKQSTSLDHSDALVQEVMDADTIVIGAPLYNFSVPAVVKAWIDQISRAGRTFRYTQDGPEGLLRGKKVVVVLASGGVQIGSDTDFASPYLKFVFGFLGIHNVTILNADQADSFAAA